MQSIQSFSFSDNQRTKSCLLCWNYAQYFGYAPNYAGMIGAVLLFTDSTRCSFIVVQQWLHVAYHVRIQQNLSVILALTPPTVEVQQITPSPIVLCV